MVEGFSIGLLYIALLPSTLCVFNCYFTVYVIISVAKSLMELL